VAEAGVNRYEEGDRTSYAPGEVDGVEKLPNLLGTAVKKRKAELFKIEKHIRRETRE
jgi:hypothetical protein